MLVRVRNLHDDLVASSNTSTWRQAFWALSMMNILQAESDKTEIKRRLDAVGSHDTKGVLQAQKSTLKAGQFTVVHLVAAAVLAFVLGAFVF